MTSGEVPTVTGVAAVDDLGITLPHEHLFIQLDNWLVKPTGEEEQAFADAPVSLQNLVQLRYRPFSNRDNIRIDDFDTVLAEVGAFAVAGGGAIVDLTPPAIGRNVDRLRRISQATGIKVISGCGYYVASSHPRALASMTPDDVAQEITRELLEGIEATGIRAGVIGEIGTSFPIHPDEQKVLAGAARAQQVTGAPMSIHLSSSVDYAHEVLDVLEQEGAILEKVAIGHLDGRHPIDVALHESIASRGAYVEYDLFGCTEFSEDGLWSPPPSDLHRIDAIRSLWDAGHGTSLLVSHDVCSKAQQRAYGGFGFSHLPGHVAPFMRTVGFSESDISTMLKGNPCRWLSWAGKGT